MRFFLKLPTFICTLLGIVSHAAVADVIYLGPQPYQPSRSLGYMTAEQMAAKVQNLTGFHQRGYEEFSRIIGTFDPKIGARTNDRPTALSVIILDGLLTEVADSVVAREIFLDDADRIVFRGIDLSQEPSPDILRSLSRRLCEEWYAITCPDSFEAAILDNSSPDYRVTWQNFLSVFLQNGTLYYL